jgi:hypothetical protein
MESPGFHNRLDAVGECRVSAQALWVGRKMLCQRSFAEGAPTPCPSCTKYDVTPDGQRFLVGILIGESKAAPPMVILNWAADLKK